MNLIHVFGILWIRLEEELEIIGLVKLINILVDLEYDGFILKNKII